MYAFTKNLDFLNYIDTHKAYVEVGEKNKHITKLIFLSCPKVQI